MLCLEGDINFFIYHPALGVYRKRMPKETYLWDEPCKVIIKGIQTEITSFNLFVLATLQI